VVGVVAPAACPAAFSIETYNQSWQLSENNPWNAARQKIRSHVVHCKLSQYMMDGSQLKGISGDVRRDPLHPENYFQPNKEE
jgi:hypothetical protein